MIYICTRALPETLMPNQFSSYMFHFNVIFYSLAALSLLQETLEVDALGALNGETQGAVPDELGEGTQTTRDTKGGGVVQGLVEAVVVEEDTGAAVDVGVRVLGLAVLLEDLGGDAAVLLNQLEDGVLGNGGAGSGVVHESLKSRVRLTQNGVAVTRHDTAGVEGRPEVIVDILLSVVGGNGLLHLENPAKNLLGGKTRTNVVSA